MDTPSTIPVENLPAWMLQAKRSTDWGMIITFLLALILAWQFWIGTDLNLLNDNENHVFMVSDIAQSLREGRWYPRWSAHVQQGYGAPVPHYYPIGAAYLAAVIEILFTNDPVVALRVTYTLAFLCIGGAIYTFTARWLGAKQALIASTLCLTSPYFGLTAPYIVGDFNAVLGYALLFTLLWSISRHLTINSSFDATMVSLLTMALILTDLRTTLLAVVMIPILLVWHRRIQHEKGIRRVLLALMTGVLMSAFFLLPAIAERDAVEWIREVVHPPKFILNVQDLIAPLQFIDPQSLNQAPQFTFGYGMWLFIAGGMIAGVLYRKQSILPLLMFGIAVVLGRSLQIIFPEQTWMVGVLVFCAAVGGSAIIYFENRIPRPYRVWFMPVLFTIILLGRIPILAPPSGHQTPPNFTREDQIRYQNEGFGIPLLPAGWDLPASVINRSLLNVGQSESEPGAFRISIDQLPGNVQITGLTETNHHSRFQIDTPQPLSAIYRMAYFPGWEATLNNTLIPVARDTRNGLISLEIPAVRNGNLEVYLGTTPVRTLGWLISGAMLLLVIYTTRRRLQNRTSGHYSMITLIPEREIYRIVPVIAAFLVLAVLLTDSGTVNSFRQGDQLEYANPVHIHTPQNLELIAYELEMTTLRRGDILKFVLYWQTSDQQSTNTLIRLNLQPEDRNFRTVSEPIRHPGGIPTKRWHPDYYVTDIYHVEIPAQAFLGTYQITLEVFTCESLCERFEVDGAGFVQSITLPETVTIEAPGAQN